MLGVASFVRLSMQYIPLGNDFIQDYVAAELYLEGETIYGPRVRETALQRHNMDGFDNFHPPLSTLFYLPFALLPLETANWVWNIVQLAALAALFTLMYRELKGDVTWYISLFGITLLWYPVIEVIGLSNSSLLLAFFLTVVWASLRRRHDGLAGSALALAIIFKVFPALGLLVFVLYKRWWAVLSCCCVLVLTTVIFILCGTVNDFILFFSEIAPKNSNLWVFFPLNFSLRGIVLPWFEEGPWSLPVIANKELGRTVYLICAAVIGIALSYTAYRKRSRFDAESYFLITIPLMIILSPIAWPHYIPCLLPCFMVLYYRGKGAERVFVLIALLAFQIPAISYLRWVQELSGTVRPIAYLLLPLKMSFVASLVIAGLLAWRRHRSISITDSHTKSEVP